MPRAKSNERVLTETLLSTLYDKDDLQDLLDNVDLPVSGKKAVLIDRLIDESDYTPYELLDYFYKENLQDICYDYDLPVSGTKDELIDRILDYFQGELEVMEEEEKEPEPEAKPSPEAKRPQRVEVSAPGVIGTEGEFLSLIKSIEGWVPRQRHKTEEGYQMDLHQYLEYECGYSCRLEGAELADIVVDGKFPVEVKKNPTQTSYDRLVGQLTRMHRAKGFAIGVVCDVRRLEKFQDFKHNIGAFFSDGSVAVVQK